MPSRTPYEQITPEDVQRAWEQGNRVVLVDVRTPVEYSRHHIPGALLIPLDEFATRVTDLSPEDQIICVCEHGVRSEMAAQYLASLGYPHVATMCGGMAVYPGPVERR